MSGAAIVTTGTGAEGFSSREVRVGAGSSTRCGWFGYFPLGGCIGGSICHWEGDRNEGKLESLGEPTRGSRDSCEDFVIVVSSECQVSVDMMGSTSGDHAATFFCLDRVIVASEGSLSFSFWGGFDPLLIGVEEFHSISEFGFF